MAAASQDVFDELVDVFKGPCEGEKGEGKMGGKKGKGKW